MQHRHWIQTAALAVICAWPVGLAAEEAAASTEDAFSFFLQEAEVVTASRRAQKKSDSPVAIDVITREEIARSGAQNIWDILRFRVGVDVTESSSIEGNAVQLNVRGLPSEFSQALQVLIDGRSVVSGTNSGTFWRNLPVALADIERIEIVRGPNSALFGANAGQGVINIITVKPTAEGKGSYRVEAGQYGHRVLGASLEFGSATAAHRASYQARQQGSGPTPQGDTSKDYNGTTMDERMNLRSALRLWEGGEIELFGGYSQRDFKIPNPQSLLNPNGPNSDRGLNREGYAMLQLRQAVDEHALELNVSRKGAENHYGSVQVVENVNDMDLLGRFNLLDGRSVTTLGGSLRFIRSESMFLFNFNGYGDGEDYEENRLGRLYAAESLGVNDWMTLALAASMESSDIGGQWPAYQGAVILKPLEGHSLRISGSKSPSMPSLQASRGDILIGLGGEAFIPLGEPFTPTPAGGFFPVALIADGVGAGPAQVASYEATWTSNLLDRRLVAEVTAFQMEIDGLINLEGVDAPVTRLAGDFAPLGGGAYALLPFAGTYVQYRNAVSLVLKGAETVLTFKPMVGTTVQLNHTYEDVYYQNPFDENDPFTKDVTPWNKANVLVATELPLGFNASGQLGWVGKHVTNLASRTRRGWIEDQGKLDLRLGYKPTPDLEIFAVGLNLAHAYRTEGLDDTAVPQVYYGGLNLAWGGK